MATKTKKKTEAAKPAKATAKKVENVAEPVLLSSGYQIEDDAYFPGRGIGLRKDYPFGALKAGQSFFEAAAFVDSTAYASEDEANKAWAESAARAQGRLQAAKRTYVKNGGLGEFSIRVVNDPKLGWGARAKRTA